MGVGATWENVYFGPTGNLSEVDTLNTSETYSLASHVPFDYNTEYQWRIDSVNAQGTTTGDTWSFTTLALSPPVITDGSLQVVKRLVAAAADTFWYEDI
jgi:hypothetical protein